jgi:hypothetical protein
MTRKLSMSVKLFTDRARSDQLGKGRPCKRVPLRIRFRVMGRDEYGFAFEDYAETVDISASGGCLVLGKDIKKGENLRLYSAKGAAFLINVRWFRYDMRKDIRYLGFELLEPLEKWVLANGIPRANWSGCFFE